jgi:hypothetical protein
VYIPQSIGGDVPGLIRIAAGVTERVAGRTGLA